MSFLACLRVCLRNELTYFSYVSNRLVSRDEKRTIKVVVTYPTEIKKTYIIWESFRNHILLVDVSITDPKIKQNRKFDPEPS